MLGLTSGMKKWTAWESGGKQPLKQFGMPEEADRVEQRDRAGQLAKDQGVLREAPEVLKEPP